MIALQDLSREFRSSGGVVSALSDINLVIPDGSLCAIVGASGSGKSTLLNLLGLLDRPSKGSYQLNGKETSCLSSIERAKIRNQSIGFVFQHYRLLGSLNVLENVCLPSIYAHEDQNSWHKKAKMWLDRVGLTHRMGHLPEQLSGGERQRVALARSLLMSPALLLADEPTGALDSITGSKILQLILELHRESATTVVIVTHDEKIAHHCPTSVRMRDGKIISIENDLGNTTPFNRNQWS